MLMSMAPAALYRWIAGAVVAAAAGAAPAQPGGATPRDLAADLRVVEQGVEDVNPLGVGRVDLSADLGISLGFGRLYELPPGPDGQRRFARRSGAVWAVFTRGEYVSSREGGRAVAPANTTLYLGEPPGLQAAAAEPIYGPLHAPLRVSTRQDLRAGAVEPPAQAAQAPTVDPPVATMLTDESYRVRRVRTLLRAAAAGS